MADIFPIHSPIEKRPTSHPEVFCISPKYFEDARGFLMETYQKEVYAQLGIDMLFVQDNQSSSKQGVLRGIHYQVSHVQGKLVRVLQGEIFDVAIDLRKSSPYFGMWVGKHLSHTNRYQLWVPPGFGHAFYTISEQAVVFYKLTDNYDPSGERCIRWDDPSLAVDWPVPEGQQPIISARDAAGVWFKDAEYFE